MSFWNKLKSVLTGEPEVAPADERIEPVVSSRGGAGPGEDRAREPRASTGPSRASSTPPAGGAGEARPSERPGFPAAPSVDDPRDAPDSRAGALAEDALWQDTYAARHAWYERLFGPFPGDIVKMRSLAGVWPGGGLYALPADRIEPGLWAFTTFGFTNPDMPATVLATEVQLEADAQGRPGRSSARLVPKPEGSRVVPPAGAAGYGYEFALFTRAPEPWPLWVLQWAANAELQHDAGLLQRVEQHEGLTVQDVDIDDGRRVNLLIAKAEAPVPAGVELPAGRMDLLVATVITQAEMNWSLQHGRGALMERLREAGVGQVSALVRDSVV